MTEMTDYTTKIAELSADIATIWRLQCQNLYNSKNLGALAIRECVQNSLDAIKSAVMNGQIAEGEGFIDIQVEGNDVIITDNGIGMDIKTLHEKFLSLGGTTKGNEHNVGGFGLAKAVILGCGESFKVETQDNIFTSEDLGKNPIQKQEYRQGTKITLHNVQTGTNAMISDAPYLFIDSIKDYVLSSDIDVTVRINGTSHCPLFTQSAKTRRTPAQFGISSTMIPEDTKLRINVYKDTDSSSCKFLYVRLRGLTQFKHYLGWNANCNIVVDFETKLDPRSPEYPFSTNREGLKAQYQGILEAIRDKVSKSPLSVSSDEEYKETLYDNVNGSVEQARAISASVADKSVTKIITEVSKVTQNMNIQGGCTAPSIADRAKQYNEQVEELAKAQGISTQQFIKQMSVETAKKLDNPLEHSWIVWEDKSQSKKLNKNRTVECIVVWDSILRLMASNYSGLDATVFYPGIVSKKDTLGLCVQKQVNGHERAYIMINPCEIKGDDDTQLALYLMGVAAHELAHFVCDTYEAHGETWAYTREAIMNANLSQLSNIIKLVKAGNLRKTLAKMTQKQEATKETCSINFASMTNDEVIEMAEQYNVDIYSYKNKYTNEPILRMRLIMAIKKAVIGS